MKNRLTTTALLLCISLYAFTQSTPDNKQSVINAAGGSSLNGYHQFEWSVGEMALINQMSDGTNKLIVTNGFIQPYLLYPGRDNNTNGFDAEEIRIFPNPATQYIEINFFTKQKGKLTVHFYDATGKKVFTKELTSNGVDLIDRIPVNALAQGVYVLHVELTGAPGSVSKKSSYKFVKIQ